MNKYNPIDDNSDTGYRRPSKNAAEVCRYFYQLGFLEDDTKFMISEMDVLINRPDDFFSGAK